MAIINQIQKALAGLEDLLVGQGTVTQTRGGQPVAISKINADNLPYSGDAATGNFVSIASKLNELTATKAPTGNLALVTTGGTTTLTATQFANSSFDISGALTSDAVIIIPDNYPQLFIVDNLTTGAFTLTIKHANTTGVTLKQNASYLLYTTGIVCEPVAQTATITAADVVNVPSGLITETDVQGALNGLEARKADVGATSAAFTGTVVAAAMNVVPAGYLECDGAAVSRTTYANLFSQIGTVFGSGDGSTTFNVPDLRGAFIRGWDNGAGIDSGRGFGTYQADAYKSHSHTYSAYGLGAVGTLSLGTTPSGKATGTASTSKTGNTETRPKNYALMYVIKT